MRNYYVVAKDGYTNIGGIVLSSPFDTLSKDCIADFYTTFEQDAEKLGFVSPVVILNIIPLDK